MTQKLSEKPYISSPMNELERKLQYPLGETLPDFGMPLTLRPV